MRTAAAAAMEVVAVAVLRAELSVDARASSLANRARFDAPSDDDDGAAEDAVDDDDAIPTLLDAPLLNCAHRSKSKRASVTWPQSFRGAGSAQVWCAMWASMR